MTEYDYWKIFPRMPKKVTLGDITVRDGFQHLEKFISTRAKIFYAEEMIFAGCRNIEVTNLGNPYLMPQFSDAEEVLAHLRSDRFRGRCQKRGINPDDITITAVTIREPAVDRAIELAKKGVGPDRCLMMVSTEEEHHFANSGTDPARILERSANVPSKSAGTPVFRCAARSAPSGAAPLPAPPN
jgi:hydroxymethylglutaryl-CoA lyase